MVARLCAIRRIRPRRRVTTRKDVSRHVSTFICAAISYAARLTPLSRWDTRRFVFFAKLKTPFFEKKIIFLTDFLKIATDYRCVPHTFEFLNCGYMPQQTTETGTRKQMEVWLWLMIGQNSS